MNDRLPARAKRNSLAFATGVHETSDRIRTGTRCAAEGPRAFAHRVRITERQSPETRRLMSLLAAELPNQAKIEMIRISRDRQAQLHVAQMLIKSTTAICAAIGAQPIPLADMPVLTMLQVLMVSGIIYISGRERSLRAATDSSLLSEQILVWACSFAKELVQC